MTWLSEICACAHPDEALNQCASSSNAGAVAALQSCARCGSFRWLRGPSPGAWQRPLLVEQAILAELSERHAGTCLRCGAKDPLKIEDCIAGAEVPGGGTEPHVFEPGKDAR